MAYQEKPSGLPPGYKSGGLRAYFSTTISPSLQSQSKLRDVDQFFLFGLGGLAFLTRFYKLPEPPKVVFDEVHFGGYVKNYFDGEFFVDVHPPLAKLIYYWIAVLFKWNGEFDFNKIGDVYDVSVPFLAMRSFSAFCGALTVLLTYLTLRTSACRPSTALFGAVLLLVENSLATQSRFIFLDAPLIFFTALVTLLFGKFQLAVPFSGKWYRYLLATGLALGLTISTKLPGFFTLAWVGVWSLYRIWCYVGDLDVTYFQLFSHIVFRVMGLFLVPVTVYCGIFATHFRLLPNNGPGSGFVSPQFRAGFVDSDMIRNTAVDVSYGSTITVKHHRLDMYLHSHKYVYKTGTKQQQVTMYGFADDNNSKWVIETTGVNYDRKFDNKFRAIKDGDSVKLYHKLTKKYLRASDVRPPNSEHDYSNEVSCHGNRTDTAESNYEWRVRIIGKKPHAENQLPLRKLRATESVFQLVHKGTNCVLMGHGTHLPGWAFHQNQVLCVNDPTIANTLWYIENNNHIIIDNDNATYPRVKLPELLLFRKILEYHHSMWRTNNGFVKEHPYQSIPFSWLFDIRGINYFSNGHGNEKLTDEDGSHIYFLGNVVIYFTGVFVILLFAAKFELYFLWHLNPFKIPNEQFSETKFYFISLQYVTGWFFNFFPYLQMSRLLFAHHYLPSVFFMILVIAQFMEYQATVRPITANALMVIIGGASVFFFVKFSPLVYGLHWTVSQCQQAKWFPTWDFDCMAYSH
ncbi:CIC11C00000004484 [Sungouiella intermedia]|uniref:Dolichyl-phosphate-mannose--protein mannosyltransferase n=1 Tax=Sungouiella intermedia TaxID=45354 RepID=A0A1L0D6M3_9ASCO|nr:CIC11C00000004484 [[Candida] intermedia]